MSLPDPNTGGSSTNASQDPFEASAGRAQAAAGITLSTLFASLVAASTIFALELGFFLLIKGKFTRIYQPRTYLVPKHERTPAPPKGIWQWLLPVFQTSNSDFIQKCGLDAYFFLRYLRTLLKIFVPLAIVIIPVLLPLNRIGGRNLDFVQGKYARNTTLYSNVAGLDQFSWGNVRPNKNDRYWAHLILAVIVVVYTCFVFFDELRGYIRLRQAYLTSPQHRLRASATTVLVTGIPRKWCTFEALDGLYDVFPGGIRNIWVNRNYDELNVKVKLRTKLADKLEAAQTTLIRNATVAYNKRAKMDAKKTKHTPSNDVELDLKKTAGERGVAMAEKPGLSSGNPHQVPHTVEEALADSPGQLPREQSLERPKPLVPIPVIGQGIETVGHGIDNIGKSVFKGLKQAGKNIDERLNTTGGFASDERRDDDDDQRTSDALENENNTVRKIHHDPDGSSDTIIRRSATQRRGLGPTSQGSQLLNDGVVAVDAGVFENTTDGKVHHAHDASYDKTVRREPTHDRGADSPTQGSQPLELPLQSGAHDFGMDGWYDDSRIRGGLAQRSTSKDFPRNNETKKQKSSVFKFWNRSEPFGIPSPTPHGKEDDEFPLSTRSPTTPGENPQAAINGKDSHKIGDPNRSSSSISCLPTFGRKRMRVDQEYPAAYNEEYNPDDDGEPEWKTYLKEKDRETMRLPICGWLWMPALPLIGKKVDTIDHCRKELARLNVEIEQDQRNPEKFPLMNSAFIQFNHQIAAHMACQSVSHHSPNAMAPRAVEISPDDVIWDNMSIKWWESYIRTAIVIALIIGLTIGWAFPVTFTGLLSQIQYLQATFKWLRWLRKAPIWVLSIIQGVLPQLLLTALIALLPVMLRLLAKSQGNYTGMAVEMSVQNYYFAFLFVQIFLVVSLSSGITTVLDKISKGPQSIPSILASDLPKASNYFFSYMILQALSVSAGALVQLMSLFKWFVLAPLLDSTARQKWARQTNLPDMQWGTFFPVYTNLAAIGLIYSVISPLIMIFNIFTFSLFWLVYRYNTLYVTKFRFDTGGLLYPRAINQLFTGLYVMELCLIGLFFLVRDVDEIGNAVGTPCKGQAIIMIVILMCTIIYQYLLNVSFGPLIRYLPITLEDEAAFRDEEFARAQGKKWNPDLSEEGGNSVDMDFIIEKRAERSAEEERQAKENEKLRMQSCREQGIPEMTISEPSRRKPRMVRRIKRRPWISEPLRPKPNQLESSRSKSSVSESIMPELVAREPRYLSDIVPDVIGKLGPNKGVLAERPSNNQTHNSALPDHEKHQHPSRQKGSDDLEAQRTGKNPIGEALFSGINDQIQDLSPEDRDKLVQRAFQHEALRAKRPVIWIPRDELGVSDDEIFRTQRFSKHIWITNDYTGLDAKGRVVYRRSPPDFSEVDLIEL